MILSIVRRELPSSTAAASSGNSRSTHWRNSGVSASWSRLRQYWGPVAGAGFAAGVLFSVMLTKLIGDTPSNS